MPLCARVYDSGSTEPRSIRWGWWHVVCMTEAARAHFPVTQNMALLTVWSQPETCNGLTVEYPMAFRDESDGEVFTLSRGDKLLVWRDR